MMSSLSKKAKERCIWYWEFGCLSWKRQTNYHIIGSYFLWWFKLFFNL